MDSPSHLKPPPDASPGGPEEDSAEKLKRLLASLWEQSKKTLVERARTLREAATLLRENRLDGGARAQAVDCAHKLAGVLGTFGLPRGTELARQAEQILEGKAADSGAAAFEPVVRELYALLEAKASENAL